MKVKTRLQVDRAQRYSLSLLLFDKNFLHIISSHDDENHNVELAGVEESTQFWRTYICVNETTTIYNIQDDQYFMG